MCAFWRHLHDVFRVHTYKIHKKEERVRDSDGQFWKAFVSIVLLAYIVWVWWALENFIPFSR